MKKYVYLIIIVFITIIVGTVCYFSIYKGNKEVDTVAKKAEENKIENVSIDNEQNENIENDINTPENVIENDIINNEINKTNDVQIANRPKQDTNSNQTSVKTTTPVQENNKQEQTSQELPKNETHEETRIEEVNQEIPTEEPEPIKLDFSKYDRYYPALNGGYTCFKKNNVEIAKLRGLLESAIQEFGYTDIKLVEDSSVISDRYFTANKTNAQNVIYNAEGCAIHYYAETEYTLSANGNESIFQVRSYAEIRGQ